MVEPSYKNNVTYKRSHSNKIQKSYVEHQYFVSNFYLFIKVCFSLLAIVSLVKLGYSSKVRMTRLKEIENSFLYENFRFKILSSRFDNLFSFDGEQRFMKEQDQIISRDIIRVIWR